jgi:hypothetical protein
LGCSGGGTWDGVISGIDWTANQAKRRGRPSVANMSLGGGKTVTLNAAVACAHPPPPFQTFFEKHFKNIKTIFETQRLSSRA